MNTICCTHIVYDSWHDQKPAITVITNRKVYFLRFFSRNSRSLVTEVVSLVTDLFLIHIYMDTFSQFQATLSLLAAYSVHTIERTGIIFYNIITSDSCCIGQRVGNRFVRTVYRKNKENRVPLLNYTIVRIQCAITLNPYCQCARLLCS